MERETTEALHLKPGDHAIVIVTHEDDLDFLPSYVAEGLIDGSLCSVIALPGAAARVQERLQGAGMNIDREKEDQHYVVHDPRQLGDDGGRFTPEVFIERLAAFIEDSKESGISHIRNMGDMSWVSEIASESDGIRVCARLNEVFKDEPITGL